jgi:RNA polymerase sigma factor (sigma-70 family)
MMADLKRLTLSQIVGRRLDPQTTDRDLLHRFVTHREEEAFESLVRRHGGMVLAVARRVVGNAHDAEDIYQATFLLLAKKAATQRWQSSISNWLHKTAHLLALKSRTTSVRRLRREGNTPSKTSTNPLAEITAEELLNVLDEELLRLPDRLRAPLVLCYLEGATRDEAAHRLNCPLGTLKHDLERGRDRLSQSLTRRGIGFSAFLVSGLVADRSDALASSLLDKTLTGAIQIAQGRTLQGVASEGVRHLVQGSLSSTSKTLSASVALIVGGLLATTALMAFQKEDEKPKPTGAPVVASATMKEPGPSNEPGKIRIRVLHQGQPVANAQLHSSIWTKEEGFKANRDYDTDAEGFATIDLPKSYYIVRFWANKKGYASQFANWEESELSNGKGLPSDYTFQLTRSVVVGGRIINEEGKPVEGAKISVRDHSQERPSKSDGRVRYTVEETVKTDANGQWSIDSAPPTSAIKLHLQVSHPDYLGLMTSDLEKNAPAIPWEQYRTQKATLTLKNGVILRGQVTDPTNKPIPNAVVIFGDDPYGSFFTCKFATDAEGRYRLPALPAEPTSITVLAPGWAPQLRKVPLKPGQEEQHFQMQPGKSLRLQIVDPQGKPLPKATVYLHAWKESKSIYWDHNPNQPKVPDTQISRKVDSEGIWHWKWAPEEQVKVAIYAPGYKSVELEVKSGEAIRKVTLTPEIKPIRVTVVDAVTGKPIPKFTVVPVYLYPRWSHHSRFDSKPGINGQLDFMPQMEDRPVRFRLHLEAIGYLSQTGEVIEDRTGVQQFRLKPSPPLRGTVVGPDGKPAGYASVMLSVPGEAISLREGGSDLSHRTSADGAGLFEFPNPGTPWMLVARNSEGIGFVEKKDSTDAVTIRLQPWGSVSGQFFDQGKPVARASIYARLIQNEDPANPCAQYMKEVQTDQEGRFRFEQLPPGPMVIAASIGPWQEETYRSGPHVPFLLKPGQDVKLDLGKAGAKVSGKVKLTGNVPKGLDCTYSLNYLIRHEPTIPLPSSIAAAGFDIRQGWKRSWMESLEGLTYLSTLPHWYVKLTPDGSFLVSGVPAGEYDLSIAVYAKTKDCLIDPLAQQVVRVKVTADDVKRGTLAIPEIAAPVVPIMEVGDKPTLRYQKLNGTTATLAKKSEGFTLVKFWASWCVACERDLPELRELQKKYASQGVSILSLSLDEEASTWKAATKRHDLADVMQGRLTEPPSGIGAIPLFWLLDRDGQIVVKENDLQGITKFLQEKAK